jgi:hypothetical protein
MARGQHRVGLVLSSASFASVAYLPKVVITERVRPLFPHAGRSSAI